ncbi:TetR/AcrR family transcriptional regulator [Actinokineospora sp. PR83]|uniref:TetR/AcrR family transcriptional regulator n=1 Tax=Actinokineospora sp. PR83 TaxID=2884908 RepID=UPI0027DEE2C7|nr:TetR/AcrR family transcriptional regulator [Actinokineospora sp. PR83]MCG8918637.1 TetR/AcrR family transcriptional regulator [Actinokineospora sp. PR83]
MSARAHRSDAVANRDRIVAEARAVLGDSPGTAADLRLHLIAKAAGVGQGTLYRHFPTREHLLAEVYRLELGELVDAVPALLAEHPPAEALARWLQRLVDYARVKRGVVAAIEASAWQDLHAGNHGRLDEALAALLERGAAAGELRDDVTAADVILLLGALSRVPEAGWDTRARALVAVILDGLRRR